MVRLSGLKMREGEWRIVKVVSNWLNSSLFEVRKLTLYKEEWERSLLIDWPKLWKAVEKLEIGWDKNLKNSWRLEIGWDKKFEKQLEA